MKFANQELCCVWVALISIVCVFSLSGMKKHPSLKLDIVVAWNKMLLDGKDSRKSSLTEIARYSPNSPKSRRKDLPERSLKEQQIKKNDGKKD